MTRRKSHAALQRELNAVRDELYRAQQDNKWLRTELELSKRPVPMLLHCPLCTSRHVDAGVFATKPHHTHACQVCGHVWRPAIGPTVGVRFLPGFRDADVMQLVDQMQTDVAAARADVASMRQHMKGG